MARGLQAAAVAAVLLAAVWLMPAAQLSAAQEALLAQLVLLTQFVLAAVVLSGPQAAPYLARIGIVLPPETWQAVQEKKVGILMGAWFIGNTVRQNLLGTGAFEVSYDGTPIFSKLDTGRMPTLPELVAGIAEAMAAAGNPAGSGTEQ